MKIDARKLKKRELNHRWHGGRTLTGGYVEILMPEHPRASCRGYVKEHLLVLEKAFGRPILKTEVIHHIDGNRQNNLVGNLILFKTNSMHVGFHNRLKAFNESGNYEWRKCVICNQYDDSMVMVKQNKNLVHRECKNKYQRDWCAAQKNSRAMFPPIADRLN
jgi:hypothetical protein